MTVAAWRARSALLLGLCAGATLALSALLGASAQVAGAAQGASASKALARSVPSVVAQGVAQVVGPRAASTRITLNVDLQVREQAGLQELITAASTPDSPSYGDYLTQAEYLARFAPTDAEVQAVVSWLRSEGLDVTGASPDNELVHVATTTGLAQRAFAITIDNYTLAGHAFYANASAPSVPSDLPVQSVGGLTNYGLPQADHLCKGVFCGIWGTEFRTAYGVAGSGEHETIGFTLWGEEIPQSEYTAYAKYTGTTAITVGGKGANGLEFIQVDGPSAINSDGEVALDTETAHALAPGIHETYWLGANNEYTTLEETLNTAAESGVKVISNSWSETGYGSCGVPPGFGTPLEHGAATGKTFFFSTGDYGAKEGCHSPASSPYAVAVGGTDLLVGTKGEWKSETAIKDDGGCTNSVARPSWQTGIGEPLEYPSTACSGRAVPDVSADSCYSGEENFPVGECWATIAVEGRFFESGGTSLAAPLWTAGAAIWNKDNVTRKRPPLGFVAPLLYTLANNPSDYGKDYHDITTGENGFAAGPGWDEATGWGSPNFKNLELSAAEPRVETKGYSAVSGLSQTTAVLGGLVYPHEVKVTGCKFEYGTTTKYGSSTPCTALPETNNEPNEVFGLLKSLKPETTYHYRISATNSAGTSTGLDAEFLTPARVAPKVSTGSASEIDTTTAKLLAEVNPELGEVTKCVFEYGTTTKYGSSVSCAGLPGDGSSAVGVSAALKGLKGTTTYHFRISATNDAGTSKGADEKFSTG